MGWLRELFSPAKPTRPLALALGGGGARGFAHIGVLKVAEELGIVPDLVVGTSMGAIVGAAWCGGTSAREIEQLVLGLDARRMLGLLDLLPPARSLSTGERALELLRPILPDTFEECGTAFACVSCDLAAGTAVVRRTGSVPDALRASFSVPFVFEPVEIDGRLEVDGGVIEPVPVQTARSLGARRIVAVSVCTLLGQPLQSAEGPSRLLQPFGHMQPGPRLQMLLDSIDVTQRELAKTALRGADMVIEPDLRGFSQVSFLSGRQIIDAGEAAARAAFVNFT